MTQVLVVLGWEKFQHYKDRDPPWIKLYRDLLTSESWVVGTDASRLVQIASMLLAARYHNATPLNFTLFRKVASLDISEAEFTAAVEHLKATNFLEIQEQTVNGKQSASKTLATCTSEAEAEAEAEREQRLRSTSSRSFRPSSSERAPRTLSKSDENKRRLKELAAEAVRAVPQ